MKNIKLWDWVVWNQRLKPKNKLTTNVTYKTKLKTDCVKCKKDTENIDPKMFRRKNKRLIMQSKCPVCRIKKSRLVKEQEVRVYWVI